jgi:hypothetical protein
MEVTTLNKNLNKIVLILVALMVIASFASLNKISATTYYHYNFAGPYYYDGSVPSTNQTVVASALWANGSRASFMVTVTSLGSTVSTYNLTSTNPVYQVIWNSSNTLNYTSVIDFQPTVTTYNINLYIPASTSPTWQYTFIPTDFAGTTNPYLMIGLSTDGSTVHILQQADLSAVVEPVFVLAQYGTYTLNFICDQGTYSQQFTAQNIYSITLPILAGAFPTANITTPTVTVSRLNATMVGVTYQDVLWQYGNTTSGSGWATATPLAGETQWLYTLITHTSGTTVITDYTTNTTGNSQTILWNGADSAKNYDVNVTASINDVIYVWVLSAPSAPPANPFLGVFDFLGQHVDTMPYVTTGWPTGMTSENIAELVGSAIVVLFLCIGSFRSAGSCAILSWTIFGVLAYLGWLGIFDARSLPMFAFSGVLAILMYMADQKETTRET